jgi:hypothetical protein
MAGDEVEDGAVGYGGYVDGGAGGRDMRTRLPLNCSKQCKQPHLVLYIAKYR